MTQKNGPTFAREYLKAEFLSSAVDGLFYARRQANLTQAQVAELLNTKQAAIACPEGANFDLVLTLYAIPFDDPLVRDLRQKLQYESEQQTTGKTR